MAQVVFFLLISRLWGQTSVSYRTQHIQFVKNVEPDRHFCCSSLPIGFKLLLTRCFQRLRKALFSSIFSLFLRIAEPRLQPGGGEWARPRGMSWWQKRRNPAGRGRPTPWGCSLEKWKLPIAKRVDVEKKEKHTNRWGLQPVERRTNLLRDLVVNL